MSCICASTPPLFFFRFKAWTSLWIWDWVGKYIFAYTFIATSAIVAAMGANMTSIHVIAREWNMWYVTRVKGEKLDAPVSRPINWYVYRKKKVKRIESHTNPTHVYATLLQNPSPSLRQVNAGHLPWIRAYDSTKTYFKNWIIIRRRMNTNCWRGIVKPKYKPTL